MQFLKQGDVDGILDTLLTCIVPVDKGGSGIMVRLAGFMCSRMGCTESLLSFPTTAGRAIIYMFTSGLVMSISCCKC